MNPILISPKIESDKSTAEQLQQMRSYLFQFKEQMELLLMNIDSDNMSEKFKDDFSQIVGNKIMNGKEMSQILQSAGAIKLQVEELGGNVASLSVTTTGIYNQIYDPDVGILSELSVLGDSIAAAVKFGVNYTGFKMTPTSFAIKSTGTFTVDSQNFIIDSNGDVTVKGHIEATEGKIGNLLIDGGWLSYKPGNTKYPVISYDNASQAVLFGSNSFSTQIRGFDLSIDCGSNHIILGSSLSSTLRIYGGYGIEIDGEITYNDGQENLNMYWQKLSDVDPDDYVITNKAG